LAFQDLLSFLVAPKRGIFCERLLVIPPGAPSADKNAPHLLILAYSCTFVNGYNELVPVPYELQSTGVSFNSLRNIEHTVEQITVRVRRPGIGCEL